MVIGGDEPLVLPPPAEVHVWISSVDFLRRTRDAWVRVLSDAERERAGRFRRSEDHNRYVTAHGWLRHLLGRYLARPAQELAFVAHPSGKPALAGAPASSGLEFNLSHSGDRIAVAVVSSGAVGVDVELIRSDFDVLELAERYFSPLEHQNLAACAAGEKTAAFFRCWTRKEAYVKARGEGLGLPLDQFAVNFGSEEMPQLVWTADASPTAEDWSVLNVEVGPAYAGAVVARGAGRKLMLHPYGVF